MAGRYESTCCSLRAGRYRRFPTCWQPHGGPVRKDFPPAGLSRVTERYEQICFQRSYGWRFSHLVSCIDFRRKIVTNKLGICHLLHKGFISQAVHRELSIGSYRTLVYCFQCTLKSTRRWTGAHSVRSRQVSQCSVVNVALQITIRGRAMIRLSKLSQSQHCAEIIASNYLNLAFFVC